MAGNYYRILGVADDAKPEEIKDAYRRRAMESHPDRTGSNGRAFQEIQEAYQTLSDPVRRREYDRRVLGRGGLRVEVRRGGAGHRPTGVEPLFEDAPVEPFAAPARFPIATRRFFFDRPFDRLWGNFAPAGRPEAERAGRLTVELPLPRAAARPGGRMRLRVPARVACRACGGTGGGPLFACRCCDGRGAFAAELPITVAWPPGVRDGDRVDLGLEHPDLGNLDLTVRFRVR